MKNIIYLKRLEIDNEITKTKFQYIKNNVIYIYKKLFNKITIKRINGFKICYLYTEKELNINKLDKQIYKLIKKESKDVILALSEELRIKKVYSVLKKYNLEYLNGIYIKKHLLFHTINYINKLQKKELNKRNITILVNHNSEENLEIIRQLAISCKSIKIVSKNIFKFRKIEEELYENSGVAINISNSYRKSLLKSEIIINIDFLETQINEYTINNKAIIINLFENIKINTKRFEGIVINSEYIKFRKELKEEFVKANIYEDFSKLILFESLILNLDIKQIKEKIEENKVFIVKLYGNNGAINTDEIKRKEIKKF